jgi:hypothetical protein
MDRQNNSLVIATMNLRKIIVVALSAIAGFSIFSLVRGAAYLETLLPGGLPIGNALSALGLCAVAGTAVALSVRGTAVRIMSLASLLAAAAWLPVSVALAGNLALNFGGGRGLIWLVFSLVVAAGAFCVLLWALVTGALAKRWPTGAA